MSAPVPNQHNVFNAASYEQQVAHAVNTQDLVGASTRSRFFSVSPPTEKTYSLVPEEFRLTTGRMRTGGNGTFEIETSADLMNGSCLVTALPGFVGVNEDADGDNTGNQAIIADPADSAATVNAPYWCEGVGQRMVKTVKFRTGNQDQAVSFSDYMMVMTEAFGDRKTRMQGERHGYYETKQEACHRSRSTQVLYIDFFLFFELDPTSALPLISMQVHKISFQIEFEKLSNLIVRPDTAANTFSTGKGTDNLDGTGSATTEYNGWESGRLSLYLVDDDADLTSTANLGSQILKNGTGEIDLNGHVEGRCIVLRKEDSRRLARHNHSKMMKQVQFQEFSVSGTSKADKKHEISTFSPTNALFNMFIIARTDAAIAANDWYDTSAGPISGRETMYRDLLKHMKLNQSQQDRVNANGQYLGQETAFRYFTSEPRQKKTKLPCWSWQADRDSTGGFSNAPKYRNRKIELTFAKEGFTAEGSEVRGMILVESSNVFSVAYGAGQADWVAFFTSVSNW